MSRNASMSARAIARKLFKASIARTVTIPSQLASRRSSNVTSPTARDLTPQGHPPASITVNGQELDAAASELGFDSYSEQEAG